MVFKINKRLQLIVVDLIATSAPWAALAQFTMTAPVIHVKEEAVLQQHVRMVSSTMVRLHKTVAVRFALKSAAVQPHVQLQQIALQGSVLEASAKYQIVLTQYSMAMRRTLTAVEVAWLDVHLV